MKCPSCNGTREIYEIRDADDVIFYDCEYCDSAGVVALWKVLQWKWWNVQNWWWRTQFNIIWRLRNR